MAYEERDQSGILFKCPIPKKHPNGPDYSGKALVNGRPVYMDAWLKEGTNGKFMSFAFKNRDAGPPKEAPAPASATIDDDIPF